MFKVKKISKINKFSISKPSLLPAFLLIELLISLALLVSLISLVGYWQLRIMQQASELQQYTQALSLAENVLEQCLAHADHNLTQSHIWQITNPNNIANTVYKLDLQVQNLIKTKFDLVQLTISWQTKFSRQPRSLRVDTGVSYL
jgi:type II secretory pathway pseudopilin PulG